MASRSSPHTLNCSFLNGQEFNPDIPCLCPEMEHRTITVHGSTGIYNFYAIYFHDTPLFMNMSAADKIKGLHMLPDTPAPHVFAIDFVESFIGGCVGKEDVVNGFFHLFHRSVHYVIYLLVCHLGRGTA